jgi:GT2 family glycosyltransferase
MEKWQQEIGKLPIIITTFNRSELTRLTLDSLAKNTDPDKYSLAVIDNNSGFETQKVISEYQSYIDHWIKLPFNAGKGFAQNFGIRLFDVKAHLDNLARPRLPRYYLLCDNDIEFMPGWIDTLVGTFEAFKDKIKLGWLSGYVYRHSRVTKKDGDFQIDINNYSPGCCVLLSREVYRIIGPFPEDRFIGAIDTTYLQLMTSKGFKNACIFPKSVIYHRGKSQRCWSLAKRTPIIIP